METRHIINENYHDYMDRRAFNFYSRQSALFFGVGAFMLVIAYAFVAYGNIWKNIQVILFLGICGMGFLYFGYKEATHWDGRTRKLFRRRR